MTRVLLQRQDRFRYELMDKAQSDDMFGEDYLQDYGLEVPTDLLERYKANIKEYEDIQSELRKLYHKN